LFIVTGGGTGIGRAIALALHKRNDKVLVTGRRAGPLQALTHESDGGIEHVICDNAKPDDVVRLAEAVTEPITGLVQCAGGNPAFGRPAPETPHETAALLDETIAANLKSAVVTTTTLESQLADDAAIVLFGSIGAEYGAGFYGPAKAAVSSYAVGLASRLGARGVRVNCLAPGYIEDTEFFQGRMTPGRAEELRTNTMIGRVGALEDVVDTTLFLLSPQARHITGQTLHLNGGAFATR
jgi:3-oxoacyl-[acyl-carrier protein] reductase